MTVSSIENNITHSHISISYRSKDKSIIKLYKDNKGTIVISNTINNKNKFLIKME